MRVHQIGGVGFDSNIYLLIDDVITLIDAGTGMKFGVVARNMKKLGVNPEDVELLLNTHCHYDHTGGDKDFFMLADCDVAVHELEADLIRSGDQIITLAGSFFGKKLEPVEVSVELRDGDHIKLGELTLEVIHTPGHTMGSVCFYERRRKLLFSGDTLFCGGVGRTDLPTSDAETLAVSLRRLSELDIDGLFPGHGPYEEKNAKKHVLDAIKYVDSQTKDTLG